MRIAKLFEKDISRSINGVVKADQLDARSVWQELDEFVVTRELDDHLRDFFALYCEAIDNTGDPDIAGKIGVWISGFFGSGKSHFIKVLSYLLDNQPHTYDGKSRQTVEFFQEKISDAMLFGDIKRAVASDTDVILFNIDNKADSGSGRDAILAVFLKVLNELQGYSPDHAHIAHLERYLDDKGILDKFRNAYQDAAGAAWEDERDAYQFHRDEVIEALSATLDQSAETCAAWVDSADSDFSLTIENFAKWTKAYLDKCGPKHRLVFLVDEVGQFIGQDTHLMLNLQTITEELGTVCNGRAWVVVTSQEDIDAVLGELQTSRANDFSKIQGRFKTRLSLSSANVDEVIQKRLLAKVDDARPELEELFGKKGDIVKNQLSFHDVGTTFKQYDGADDFINIYPFAPYQFKLLQRIFESIRKAGATGLHLAQGERSLLDAFQSAGKAVANKEVGILVPLYLFYPAIESFLDSAVKRTIDHAAENRSLEPQDIHLLQVLFLIRYVDEMKGNVDNLVTLCLDEIDADRLGLKRKIEASLQRLEKETLISRSGDSYFFLTNEERDVNREIKDVDLSSGEEARLLGELIFDDVLRSQRKHRFTVNKKDFSLTRMCDLHPVGNRADGGLTVSVVTPLNDDYESYGEGKCIGASGEDDGQVLIRLNETSALGRRLRTHLKTDKYLRTHDDSGLPATTRRIHRDLADENRQRRERLTSLLAELVADGGYYIAGQSFKPNASEANAILSEALEYLIRNTFSKMGFLTHMVENPLREIQALLRSDDVGQETLNIALPENNPQAIQELRDYLELSERASRKVVMHDLITTKFAHRPYGWPDLEVVLLLTRLYMSGEILFLMSDTPIPRERLYELISTSSKWRLIKLVRRKTVDSDELRRARDLGHKVFAEVGPDSEDGLHVFLQRKLEGWNANLTRFKALADTGKYPGIHEIEAGIDVIQQVLAATGSYQFLQGFSERGTDLEDLAENYHDLKNFYGPQKATWDKLLAAYEKFTRNRLELERNEAAAQALLRMQEILKAPAPYGLIKEAAGLITTVADVNDGLVNERRQAALLHIDVQIALIEPDLKNANADNALSSACLGPLERLKISTASQDSLAHLLQAKAEAVALKDAARERIEEYLKRKPPTVDEKKSPPVKATCVIKPAVISKGDYLETREEVEIFLKALKKECEAAVDKNERIEIR